jgi:hypothetical protein
MIDMQCTHYKMGALRAVPKRAALLFFRALEGEAFVRRKIVWF